MYQSDFAASNLDGGAAHFGERDANILEISRQLLGLSVLVVAVSSAPRALYTLRTMCVALW